MASRPKGFGLTGEVNRKIANKYDVSLEQEARLWMEEVLGEPLLEGADSSEPLGMDKFHEALKDGKALCKLISIINPSNAVKKINDSKMPFLRMENISKFLEHSEAIGVHKTDLFQTSDLYDKVNMYQVVNAIYAVGRKAHKCGYNGPVLGCKESDENRRSFSQEQLNAGQTIIGLQMGTNKGASQSGMKFGATRQILD